MQSLFEQVDRDDADLRAELTRWSDLQATAISDEELRPERVRVNYQTRADGGCDNTSVALDELGILQITAVQREVPQAAILPVPGA